MALLKREHAVQTLKDLPPPGTFDPAMASRVLSRDPPFLRRHCARYVREALQAGGITFQNDWPVPAKRYDGYLQRYRFSEVASSNNSMGYVPWEGDVVIVQPPPEAGKHAAGHITMVVAGKNGTMELARQGDLIGYRQLTMTEFRKGQTNGLSITVLRHESQWAAANEAAPAKTAGASKTLFAQSP